MILIWLKKYCIIDLKIELLAININLPNYFDIFASTLAQSITSGCIPICMSKKPPHWNKVSLSFVLEIIDSYRVTQKTYSCLIKLEMHNKRGIFIIIIVLNYQWGDLNFDILVLIFGFHLAEIWMLKASKCFENFRKWGKFGLSMWLKNQTWQTPHTW